MTFVFSLAFVVLFVLSALALIATFVMRNQPEDREKVSAAGAVKLYLLMVALSIILALHSSFELKYLLLAFMIASLSADIAYAWRVKQRTVSQPKRRPTKRRFWWQVVDNSLWLAVTLMLFLG
jgi:uncharacterized membrane protein